MSKWFWAILSKPPERKGSLFESLAGNARGGVANHQLLHLSNCCRRIQSLGAGLGAVHDGVAAVERPLITQLTQPLLLKVITRIHYPPVGLHDDGRSEVLVSVPPVARACGRTTRAQNALVHTVQLSAFLWSLEVRDLPNVGVVHILLFEVRLDRLVLRVEVVHVRHKVLDDVHVWQWVDLARLARACVYLRDASERVAAVDVHRAGAADSLATRPPEGQRRVDLVLDLDQRVENHRAAAVEVKLKRLCVRLLSRLLRVVSVDEKLLHTWRLRNSGGGRCGKAHRNA